MEETLRLTTVSIFFKSPAFSGLGFYRDGFIFSPRITHFIVTVDIIPLTRNLVLNPGETYVIRNVRSSRPKVTSPEVMSPETRVMSPDILSHVARNFIMLKKILKMLVRMKCATVKLRLFVSLSFYGDSKPKIKHVLPVAKDSCLKCAIFFTLDPLKFSGVDESNLDGAHRGLSMEQLNQEVER